MGDGSVYAGGRGVPGHAVLCSSVSLGVCASKDGLVCGRGNHVHTAISVGVCGYLSGSIHVETAEFMRKWQR